MTSFDFSTGSPKGVQLRHSIPAAPNDCSCSARSCGLLGIESPQEYYPQSVGCLFHVKPHALSALAFVRTKPRCPSGIRHPSKVIISFTQRRPNFLQSFLDATSVVTYTQIQANGKTPAQLGQPMESDRKASRRI